MHGRCNEGTSNTEVGYSRGGIEAVTELKVRKGHQTDNGPDGRETTCYGSRAAHAKSNRKAVVSPSQKDVPSSDDDEKPAECDRDMKSEPAT